MQDEEVPPSRLKEIMDAVARSLEGGASEPGVADLGKRRAEIDKAASLLVEHYGPGALDRARLLEQRQPNSRFAQSVRLAVEKVVAEGNRS